MGTDHPLMGKRFLCLGRPVTVGESYEGHGPDDPSGYYYQFDDKPGTTHWISAGALPIRFTKLEGEGT